MLRRNPAAGGQAPAVVGAVNNDPSPEAMENAKQLGIAVVQGQPGAFGKLRELAKAQHAVFNTNKVGLNDSQISDLHRQAFAPLFAAFKVIEEAAVGGTPVAVDAVAQSLQIPELQGLAVRSIGLLAGNGNDTALEILLDPRKYGLLQSSTVGALRPAADSGNQQAIDALAAVAGDPMLKPLWYLAADGLEKSAESGNAVALDALIGLSTSTTNISVRNVVVSGLKAAAANQNAKAAQALRTIGGQ
jgi:hypothetical protein